MTRWLTPLGPGADLPAVFLLLLAATAAGQAPIIGLPAPKQTSLRAASPEEVRRLAATEARLA